MPPSPARRRFLSLLLGTAAAGLAARPNAGTALPRLHAVEIKGFAFDPPQLEIRVGDGVIWTNRDLAPHTASADDGAWDSGSLAKNRTYRARFERPGSFPYHCVHHPLMRGRISVIAT